MVIVGRSSLNPPQITNNLLFIYYSFLKLVQKCLRTSRANPYSSIPVAGEVSELHITGWHSLKGLLFFPCQSAKRVVACEFHALMAFGHGNN